MPRTEAARGVPSLPARADFEAGLGFALDAFQVKALDALDEGRSVLVAAPTGSGKTVVAEYAIATARAEGGKAFYTTPLKALSNQKYGDLVRRHGADQVGLLTGDNVINGPAPILVMTTEVLRNMIYAGSGALDGLRFVVLDEVHYLQNAYRGPVWEEVIIHLAPSVRLVGLSATVSNAEELADWMAAVRGRGPEAGGGAGVEAVIEEHRPVDLHNLYMVGDRSGERPLLLPSFVEGRPNPEAATLDSVRARAGERGRQRRGRLMTPRRAEVVERLYDEEMLPCIFFIFSRAACNDAVLGCLRQNVRLTSAEERPRIRAIAEAHVENLSDADLAVLDYGTWLTGLEAGVASHHAGMVPPFKEAVEQCFAEGLVKVCFATETLSLGINMPARSVVIEKLTKFTGERHEFLTPGEYTQLTGRAGRRGIDDVGYAIVLWSPFVPFDQVAGLASTRTYALSSSFRPTYNMAANLVRRYPPDEAHHLLNLSFAQYRADADVVRLETQLGRLRVALAEARVEATCGRGDVEDYRARALAADAAARQRPSARAAAQAALERVKPGDVLVVPGSGGGKAVVITTARRKGGEVRIGLLTVDHRRTQLAAKDFSAPPRVVGRVDLPRPYAPDDKAFRGAAAAALRDVELTGTPGDEVGATLGRRRLPRGDRAVEEAGRLAVHPVSSCPQLRRHIRAAERADRLVTDAERLETRVRGRSESLARQFDRVLRVLEVWGYIDGWMLTEAGQRLARTYHEADLLVTECVGEGLLDGLSAPEVAALVSTFTYETRGPGDGPVAVFPTARAHERWTGVERVAGELRAAEEEAGLPLTRSPDPGFVALAYAWACGRPLEELLGGAELSGGDFVRNVKTLLDLLRQLGATVAEPTASSCRVAAEQLFRGVVAASSVVGTGATAAAAVTAGVAAGATEMDS